MNLHIVPDNVFINQFYDNLQELGILNNNKIVVRTNNKKLQYIQQNVSFAKLYSSGFNALVGDTGFYDKVYIHQFTPLLYRWVAHHNFKELNWMVWGADLYSLPSVNTLLYEKLTLAKYVNKNFSWQNFLYQAKVFMLHSTYRNKAYAKVKNVLTWMTSEYNFALHHIQSLKASHQFFFYENQTPYKELDKLIRDEQGPIHHDPPIYILGNSSTSELNHLDAVEWMDREGVKADLFIPVSYGDATYTRFLKKNLSFYKGGAIHFVDRYMNFQEYLQFLYKSDGLIMNNIRPQGYGNIFMMMYLGKKVFLNKKNPSINELNKSGLIWHPMEELKNKSEGNLFQNKSAVSALLEHQILLKVYSNLFS